MSIFENFPDPEEFSDEDKEILVDLFIRFINIGCDVRESYAYSLRALDGDTVIIYADNIQDNDSADHLAEDADTDWITYIFTNFIDLEDF
jgi:hypothetical protein